MYAPLPPLDVPWTMKPLESAQTRVEVLADGRIRFSIRHDVLRGVTPVMLAWWFNNIDGDIDLSGRRIARYRVWHPRDHVLLEYVRKARDGRNFGPGARVHIVEFLDARPEYKVDILSTIEFLDETGLAHSDRIMGIEVARLDYRLTPVAGGTLYTNSLTVGPPGPATARFLVNRFVRPRLFPEKMGEAASAEYRLSEDFLERTHELLGSRADDDAVLLAGRTRAIPARDAALRFERDHRHPSTRLGRVSN